MNEFPDPQEVEAVFAAMHLPIIEQSIQDIQRAKNSARWPGAPAQSDDAGVFVHRFSITDGTAPAGN